MFCPLVREPRKREKKKKLAYSVTKNLSSLYLKDLPSWEKSRSVAEVTLMNQALPAPAAFGPAYMNIF